MRVRTIIWFTTVWHYYNFLKGYSWLRDCLINSALHIAWSITLALKHAPTYRLAYFKLIKGDWPSQIFQKGLVQGSLTRTMIIIFFTVYKYVVANIYTILLILFDIQAKCMVWYGRYVRPANWELRTWSCLVNVKYTV